MQRPSPDKDLRIGIAIKLLATFFFSFQGAVTKTLIQHYSVWQLVFVEFSVLLVVVTGVAVQMGQAHVLLKTRNRAFQPLRGVVLIIVDG